MNLQRRLAAELLQCGRERVRFAPDRIAEIKEAITKFDVLQLIKKGAITRAPIQGISRARAKARHKQQQKGRRKGHGSRKGPQTARSEPKAIWMANVRAQRALLKRMRIAELLDKKDYRALYRKVGGHFFRSTRHIKLYTQEQGMLKKTKT